MQDQENKNNKKISEYNNIVFMSPSKSSLKRIDPLDIPGIGDPNMAKQHGRANMLYKVNIENIQEDIGNLIIYQIYIFYAK